MPEHQLFEDDITLDTSMPSNMVMPGESRFPVRRRLFVGFAVVTAIVGLCAVLGPLWKQSIPLTLSGPQVAQLRPGAEVLFDGTPAGNVEQVSINNGIPSAQLRIDPQVLAKMPSTSRIEVGSLNRVLPGNVGVKISSVGQAAGSESPSTDWRLIRERLADNSVLPAQTPLGFYGVMLAIILIGLLVFRALKSVAIWNVVVVAALLVGLYAWNSGKLNVNDVVRWFHDRAAPTGTSTEPHNKNLP